MEEKVKAGITENETEGVKRTKAVVMGCACVVFSALTPEQIMRFKRYQPDLLKVTDDYDPDSMFTLDIDNGPGHLDENGVLYSRTKSADGRATLTVLLDPEEVDKFSMVQEKMGLALSRLQGIEESLLRKLDVLDESEQRINSMFTWL